MFSIILGSIIILESFLSPEAFNKSESKALSLYVSNVSKRISRGQLNKLLKIYGETSVNGYMPDPDCMIPFIICVDPLFCSVKKGPFNCQREDTNWHWCAEVYRWKVGMTMNNCFRKSGKDLADPNKWRAPRECSAIFTAYDQSRQATYFYRGCITLDSTTPWCSTETVYVIGSLNNKYCIDITPINGGWSEWTPWSDCTKSCGSGRRSRDRKCDNPSPQYGGKDCEGKHVQEGDCNTFNCPINGGWSGWTPWSDCTKTCGSGSRSRDRECDNPSPQYGGKDCEGHSEQEEVCNTVNCPTEVVLNLRMEEGFYEAGTKIMCDTPQKNEVHYISVKQICENKNIWSFRCSGASCDMELKGFINYQFCTVMCDAQLYPEIKLPVINDSCDICMLPSYTEYTICEGKCGIGRQLRHRSCLLEYGQSIKNDRPCFEYDEKPCDTGIKCKKPKFEPPLTKRANIPIQRKVKYIWDLYDEEDEEN